MTDQFPHVPAAFINAISEEGTKAEAVACLQKEWNENCALKARIKVLEDAARKADKHLDNIGYGELTRARKVLRAALKQEKANG